MPKGQLWTTEEKAASLNLTYMTGLYTFDLKVNVSPVTELFLKAQTSARWGLKQELSSHGCNVLSHCAINATATNVIDSIHNVPKWWETANLVTFIEEILNGKLHFYAMRRLPSWPLRILLHMDRTTTRIYFDNSNKNKCITTWYFFTSITLSKLTEKSVQYKFQSSWSSTNRKPNFLLHLRTEINNRN